MERKAGRAYRSVLDLVVATCTAALAGAMSVVRHLTLTRDGSQASYRARRVRVLMCSARVSHVGVKGATCDLSELDLRSQRRRVALGGDTIVPPQDAQRQLQPRRVDGCTQQVARCATVHLAGSQLPLRVLGRYKIVAAGDDSTLLRSEIKP